MEGGGVNLKKLILIFIICVFTLYGIMFCYADFQNNTLDIMADLPLAMRFEPSDNLKVFHSYHNQLLSILEEQKQNLNTLNYIYYLGDYYGSFDGRSLARSMKWDNKFIENAPLFHTDIYKGYYSFRTEKIRNKYQSSEFFDDTAFIKTARQEFDSYINTAAKDQKSRDQLIVQMQSKLEDKLIEQNENRKAMLDEILSLRQAANHSKSLDYIFQLFESRVRLQLHQQMVDANKQKLEKLVHRIGISITAEGAGQLLLQSRDEKSDEKAIQIMNVLEDKMSYQGFTLLSEFYGKENYKLVFRDESGSVKEVELEKAIDGIAIDKNGHLNLDLDQLFAKEQNSVVSTAAAAGIADETQLKSLELIYSNKTKEAQAIIKELNRYSIYLELKDKKISNYYTRSFESNQKLWTKDLEDKLNAFGKDGMVDFVTYIKRFELLDRKAELQKNEKAFIARFRNSDIQFRKTEEASLWITNMMFRIKYKQ
jgi:hypothetical protein